MNKEDNIMDKLKECPYQLPSNYASQIEDKVRERLNSSQNSPKFALLHSNLALLAVFLIVFGIGYSIIKIATPEEYLKAKTQNKELATISSISEKDTSIKTITESDVKTETVPASKDEAIEEYLIESNMSIMAIAAVE